MSERKARSAAPIHLITVVPALAVVGDYSLKGGGWVGCTGVWVNYSRRYGTRWSNEHPARWIDRDRFWDYVLHLCQKGWKPRVIAPNGSQLLTLTSFWQHVESGAFRVLDDQGEIAKRGKNAGKSKRPWMGRLVLKGTPTIVSARTAGGGGVTILSATNYADVPSRVLCRCVGVTPRDHDQGDEQQLGDVDPDQHCFALHRWFRQIISGWVAESCGPWGDTAGALGLSLWRATDGPKSVARHDRQEALEIEAAALHGGRATVWYYGSVGDRGTCPPPPADPPPEGHHPNMRGRAHKLDVRSMYPWLLAHNTFPIKLQGIKRNLTPYELAGFMGRWCGIAVVRMKVKEPEYPVRIKDRTRYPVGPVVTTLAGPELLRALQNGEIEHCLTYVRYAAGEPFQKWGRFVLGKRVEARTSGDPATELLWKIVANSFGGKFAQKSRRWLPVPRESAPRRWGDYLVRPPGAATLLRRRALAGIPHRLETGLPGSRLPAAVYCYLTAYGRLHMHGIRTMLGTGVVLSQDTDGLWVNDLGLKRARRFGLLDGEGPGSLRHEASTDYARWWDARHYYSSGKWTLAGVASGWTLRDTGIVSETRKVEPAGAGMDPGDAMIFHQTRSRELARIMPDSPVGPDGWARPYTLADLERTGKVPGQVDADEAEKLAASVGRRRRRRTSPTPELGFS